MTGSGCPPRMVLTPQLQVGKGKQTHNTLLTHSSLTHALLNAEQIAYKKPTPLPNGS